MHSEIHDTYTLLRDDKDDVTAFAKFLSGIWEQFAGNNMVIDLLQYEDLTIEQLISFLDMSNVHRASKQSFVMLNTSLSFDEIPPELAVAPTLQEALDLIAMEEIERDLGF